MGRPWVVCAAYWANRLQTRVYTSTSAADILAAKEALQTDHLVAAQLTETLVGFTPAVVLNDSTAAEQSIHKGGQGSNLKYPKKYDALSLGFLRDVCADHARVLMHVYTRVNLAHQGTKAFGKIRFRFLCAMSPVVGDGLTGPATHDDLAARWPFLPAR